MAKRRFDEDLFNTLRARGLRKKVARTVAEAAGRTTGRKKPPKAVSSALKDLRSLVGEIEDRATGKPARRKAAARKAAQTRKRKAARRSQAAKKGAKTRSSAS